MPTGFYEKPRDYWAPPNKANKTSIEEAPAGVIFLDVDGMSLIEKIDKHPGYGFGNSKTTQREAVLIQRLKDAKEKGYKIVILTARPKAVEKVIQFLEKKIGTNSTNNVQKGYEERGIKIDEVLRAPAGLKGRPMAKYMQEKYPNQVIPAILFDDQSMQTDNVKQVAKELAQKRVKELTKKFVEDNPQLTKEDAKKAAKEFAKNHPKLMMYGYDINSISHMEKAGEVIGLEGDSAFAAEDKITDDDRKVKSFVENPIGVDSEITPTSEESSNTRKELVKLQEQINQLKQGIEADQVKNITRTKNAPPKEGKENAPSKNHLLHYCEELLTDLKYQYTQANHADYKPELKWIGNAASSMTNVLGKYLEPEKKGGLKPVDVHNFYKASTKKQSTSLFSRICRLFNIGAKVRDQQEFNQTWNKVEEAGGFEKAHKSNSKAEKNLMKVAELLRKPSMVPMENKLAAAASAPVVPAAEASKEMDENVKASSQHNLRGEPNRFRGGKM